MAQLDVDMIIEELTLDEKIALTAGQLIVLYYAP